MPETPPSLLDRFLRSDATMYAGLGEITRDYVDKMPLAAPQEAQSVARLDRDQSKVQSVVYTPQHSEQAPKQEDVPW